MPDGRNPRRQRLFLPSGRNDFLPEDFLRSHVPPRAAGKIPSQNIQLQAVAITSAGRRFATRICRIPVMFSPTQKMRMFPT
jgi:hypothetical protein